MARPLGQTIIIGCLPGARHRAKTVSKNKLSILLAQRRQAVGKSSYISSPKCVFSWWGLVWYEEEVSWKAPERRYEEGMNWVESGVRVFPAEETASVRALLWKLVRLSYVPCDGSTDSEGESGVKM